MDVRHPGLLRMPAKQYHADQSIGHSGIIKLLKSPAHLREALDHPSPPTPAMAFGSAVHTHVLEPDRFSEEFAVVEKFDRRTKEGKEAAARFEQENQGKTLITSDDLATLTRVRAAVHAHEGAARLFKQGEAELSAFWTDPLTGIPCRCRPDWFNGTAVVGSQELCRCQQPRLFSRHRQPRLRHSSGVLRRWNESRDRHGAALSLRRRREGGSPCRGALPG
jgi:hypothetical protein